MRKYLLTVFTFTAVLKAAWAQHPVIYRQTFDDTGTGMGIRGKALDLTENAPVRKPLQIELDHSALNSSFTITLWVKAAADDFTYELLSLTTLHNDSLISSWTLGKQASHAWYWNYTAHQTIYRYEPTRERQPITRQWHQLRLCYIPETNDVWLYYDGCQVAIYHVPDIQKHTPDRLLLQIGGRPDGEMNEWSSFNGSIDEVLIEGGIRTAAETKAQYAAIMPDKSQIPATRFPGQFRIMTFNIWHGGNETGIQTGPQRVADIIRESGADIVTMQETYGSGARIADMLGYYFYLRSSNLSIMSRYPITETIAAHHPFNSAAARIDLNGMLLTVACNWLNYPMDYWNKLEKGERVSQAEWQQFDGGKNAGILRSTLETLAPALDQADSIPMIFSGDFNSGSHLDWTAQTKHLHAGYIVSFPASMLMEQAGFTDSFRHIHADPLKERGITWTPAFPQAFKDRIDFIFYKGNKIDALSSEVIGNHPIRYPSDHGALISTFKINR